MTGANELDEAGQSDTPGIVRVDRLVRRLAGLPTLCDLNYDGSPPRCGSCAKRFIKRSTRPDGKKVRKLMCALAKVEVHARGVCDSWRGFSGDVRRHG